MPERSPVDPAPESVGSEPPDGTEPVEHAVGPDRSTVRLALVVGGVRTAAFTVTVP